MAAAAVAAIALTPPPSLTRLPGPLAMSNRILVDAAAAAERHVVRRYESINAMIASIHLSLSLTACGIFRRWWPTWSMITVTQHENGIGNNKNT